MKYSAVICLVLLSRSDSWAQANYERQPPFLLSPAEDTVKESIREARSKHFNVRAPYSMIEANPSDGTHPFTRYSFYKQAELPYDDVATVVVGEVVTVQPFLSSDRKGIYNEYILKVQETIKNTAATTVIDDELVTLLRRGGSARFADGRIVKHDIVNDVTPVVGQRYLFFLTYNPSLEAFDYAKIWLFQEGIIKPLYPDDLASEHAGKSEYSGKSLIDVITQLKSRISR